MKKTFQNVSESQFFTITSFAVALVISVISIQYFFTQDYTKLLNQVKKTLTTFSSEREKVVSQFLMTKNGNLEFVKVKNW